MLKTYTRKWKVPSAECRVPIPFAIITDMAYVLTSELGDTDFGLEITSYEFPDNPANELDANWVVIVITAQTAEGSWRAGRAALLTWELEDLISWCRANYRLEPLTQFV